MKKAKMVVGVLVIWVVCFLVYQFMRLHLEYHPTQRQHLELAGSMGFSINAFENRTQVMSHPRIFCIIFTIPKNIEKTLAVKNTWAKRCDKYAFFSNVTNSSLPMVALNVTESRQYLSRKTRLAFEYAYEHHGSDFDWFLKADDDTYVIVENLRHHLKQFNPDDRVYVGKKFTKHGGITHYMSGGAGYVFSRAAVKAMVSECFKKYPTYFYGGVEDVAAGHCAQADHYLMVNISTDALDRERFHSLSPYSYLKSLIPKWLYRYSHSKVRTGFDCCSNETITFHYVRPDDMYMIELFLYHIKLAGT